ncbi:unnamed protein product [Mucor hiemalis]
MSFNIPGYFLDQKTKKLFKIQSHGPFSLKELKKRLQEEEEQEAMVAEASSATAASGLLSTKVAKTSMLRSPTNLTHYLRQRATSGIRHALMAQLRTRSTVELEGPPQNYGKMLVDLTTYPDFGEAVVSYRPGKIARFGYQVNPGFQMWNTGQDWTSDSGEVLSLQFGTRNFVLNGEERRTIVGTSDGKLWRYSVPKLPALSTEDLKQQFVTANGSIRNDEHIIGIPPTSYIGTSEPLLDCLFTKKKDLFFSSSLDDQNDNIAVGGDQALYHLNSRFDLISSQKVRSSIFSTHLPIDQPYLCWSGARNGNLLLTDFRQVHHQNAKSTPRFKQSSSILNIQKLAGYELLTTGMDGSINIWDTRQPKRYNSNSKRKKNQYNDRDREPATLPEPIRSLKGHVNESTQHLAFDIDLENNLLMLSGSDGRVRTWSIFNSSSNEPIWCSEKFSSPIPAVKFMVNSNQYPRVQDGWTSVLDESALTKNYPGILLFGVKHENSDNSAIQWLTGVN